MVSKAFTRFLSFASRLILRQLRRTNSSKIHPRKSGNSSQSAKCHKINPFTNDGSELVHNATMICDFEGGLLKSSNLFPYFMLVAFEAGSILRALVLLALYPLLRFAVSEELRLRIMVMVCFFGIRKDGFRLGSSVLPKYFLEDVGLEVFEVLNMKTVVKKVAVSNMPRIMVESLLKDYMGFDSVVATELKVFHGFFVGLIDHKPLPSKLLDGEWNEKVVGIFSVKNSSATASQMLSICDETCFTTETERSHWKQLPAGKYPNPLIFHDGRLAFRPTSSAALAMLTWFPFGVFLALVRSFIGFFMPYTLSIPLLAFSGLKLRVSSHNNGSQVDETEGILYVCNHRTLLDPLYLSFILKKNLTAVTYSLSRVSEFLSPIKTVRLTRDFYKDSNIMKHMLTKGYSLVVCPEGTTCREPYLLRFSPMFAEMSNIIVPVALDTKVSMFHGTTASGLKCLDPFFFLVNPFPSYTVKFLNPVSGLSSAPSLVRDDGAKVRDSRRFEIANRVQDEIGKSLDFTCTKLTRKYKYLVLAGNDGTVSA